MAYRMSAFAALALAWGSFAAGADSTWIATWAAAPSAIRPARSQEKVPILEDHTLRQIVHTSIGGTSVRIHLSNLFGSKPLHLEDVRIALTGSGEAGRPATFKQSHSVLIPAGSKAVSDPVNLRLPANSDVAISIYFLKGEEVPEWTGHSYIAQTNYLIAGNQSQVQNWTSPSELDNYYFLTGLDVQNSSARGALIAFGASITDGFGSTKNANHRWTNFLAQRINQTNAGIGVVSAGISGNKLLSDNGAFGVGALKRFERDVLEQAGVRWVILSDDPINDLSGDPAIPFEKFLIAYRSLISQAHARKLKFFCSTLTPFEGASRWTTQAEKTRERINDFVRSSQSGCDGVIDQDLATHDPRKPTRFLPAFDNGDHLHPNDAGYQAIANSVRLELLK
jgi:lysophospholipase L1-like esterase